MGIASTMRHADQDAEPAGSPRAEDRMIAFRLARVNARLNAQAAQLVANAAGISLVQFRIMLSIEKIGAATPTDIGRHSEFDKGQLSRAIKVMLDEGLLRASHNAGDLRSHLLSLTQKGRQKFEAAQIPMLKRQAQLLKALQGDELSVLMTALDKLERASGDDIDAPPNSKGRKKE